MWMVKILTLTCNDLRQWERCHRLTVSFLFFISLSRWRDSWKFIIFLTWDPLSHLLYSASNVYCWSEGGKISPFSGKALSSTCMLFLVSNQQSSIGISQRADPGVCGRGSFNAHLSRFHPGVVAAKRYQETVVCHTALVPFVCSFSCSEIFVHCAIMRPCFVNFHHRYVFNCSWWNFSYGKPLNIEKR